MPVCTLLPFLAVASLAQNAPDTHPLFDGDRVHEIRLTFHQPDWWERLRANFEGLADPIYLEAGFDWGEVHFEKIGVRFKGNSSYRTYPGKKKSFKLKLNEFVKGQKIAGIDSLNLNNAFKDPTFVREKVYYELAAAAGLPAPRVNYAAVTINGEYWGLYFLVEGVDSAFLESRFGKKEDGNLYKGDPMGTLQWMGPDPERYRRNYEKENNEKADDWSDLTGLADTLNNRPIAELHAKLDTGAAAAFLALDNLTVNLDSYIGSGHNYFLYHRQSDDRFITFPWDPNEAWGSFNMGLPIEQLIRLPLDFVPRLQPGPPGGQPGQPGPPPGQPGPPPGPPQGPPGPAPQDIRPLATKIQADPELRELYRSKLRSLLDGPAHPDTLFSRMLVLRDLIRPWVEQDTNKMYPAAQFERSFTEHLRQGMPIPGLEPFLRERAAYLLEELAK